MRKVVLLTLFCMAILCLSARSQEVEQIERLYQQGLQQLEQKQCTEAQKTFHAILSINSRHAKSYFQLGKISIEFGNNELAEKYFKKSLDLDSKLAEAYHCLGVLYLNKNTLDGRLKASPLLLKAAAMDQNNNEFLTDLAILRKEQDLAGYAFSLLDKVIERDSMHIRALTTLAELHEQRWLEYLATMRMEEVDIYSTDGVQEVVIMPILMHPWANEDLVKAMQYNHRIILVEPDNRDALYRQGLIYYELGNPVRLIELFSSIVSKNPGDKDGHFFLGLGYHQLGEFEKAFQEFNSAMKLMNREELAELEQLPCFASPKDAAKFAGNSQNYWKAKDPLFITGYNERELEHYCRVAYANLRFSIPRAKIVGWKTDRGEAYIRYGKPKSRTRVLRNEWIQDPVFNEFVTIDWGQPPNVPLSNKVTKITPARESWKYPDFILTFEDPVGSNNHYFFNPIGLSPKLKFIHSMEEFMNEVPEVYENPYRERMIPMIASCVDFRGKQGKALVEISYKLPLSQLSPLIKQNMVTLDLKQGTFFFNDDWNESFKQTKDRTLRRQVSENYSDTLEMVLIEGDRCFVEPGKYHFAFELKDNNTGKLARFQRDVEIPSYSGDQLQMSGIQLAYSITHSKNKGDFIKNGLYILPNPDRKFRMTQILHLYFEIYNLKMDGDGNSIFIIETSIRGAQKKERLIARMFYEMGKFLGIHEQSGVVKLSYGYQGNRQDEFINTALDIHELSPGEYALEILIRDENTNQTTMRSTNFIVTQD